MTPKEKKNKYNREYYLKNKNNLLIKNKVYREENKESISIQRKIYTKENKINKSEYDKAYSLKNKIKIREYNKLYQKLNSKKIAANKQVWYNKNRESIRKKARIYRLNSKFKRKEYYNKKLKNNPQFIIKRRIRNRVRKVLNSYIETGKINESKSLRGELYKNINIRDIVINLYNIRPKDWKECHIDHIIPLASFDLTDSEQLKTAMSIDNLQWLKAKENMSKGCKLKWDGKY